MSPILLAAFLCALVACIIKFARSRPPMFPPGPPRLPLYGGYLHLLAYNYRYTYKGLVAMAARYKSPVLGLYVGSDPTVIATDFASTREMLLKPEFQGRPDTYAARLRSFDELLGIFFVDGSFWAEQRRFSLRHLRDFGFGRRFPRLETAVGEEIRTLFEAIQHPVGTEKRLVREGQVLLPDLLYAGFTNALLETLAGERLPRARHETLRALSRAVRLFQRHVEPSGGVINITPWLRHLAPTASSYRGLVEGNDGVVDFIQDELLSRQVPTFDAEVMRGFIDVFRAEMLNRGEDKSGFTEKQLIMVLVDYIFPSTTVPPVTVAMAIAYLVRHPDKAERAHREIVAVVGRGRLPNLDDRASLPYTEAILREVLRLETNTVLSVTHRCTEDTFFRGYFVPKGTLLIPNIWAANRDPAVFEKADQFVPERFLDLRSGMLRKKDDTMPFGLGKRLCAGETFSRQNMFLYLSALLQNFSFELGDDGYLPTEDDMVPGILVTPKSFWVRLSERP
ncbi:Cytochrome P450 CYP304 [Frankliniella occidentalis]|uniref:Probable cytochrome P450 304a1 n=1 Tax=Frankliniella occidentalis TaxID=133901 RepID=A0A6J1T987_FRAOC|nr:probable cytochrome P450 304a1 [Frankliniella occidentalis]KAE8739047.1 Cytochrome P450 CYP304 [Frankliniella occidentalis]